MRESISMVRDDAEPVCFSSQSPRLSEPEKAERDGPDPERARRFGGICLRFASRVVVFFTQTARLSFVPGRRRVLVYVVHPRAVQRPDRGRVRERFRRAQAGSRAMHLRVPLPPPLR